MSLTPVEERLNDLIEPVAEAEGFELVRVKILSTSGHQTLQVMAERPDGSMTAEDCAILSRAISPVLDFDDPLDGKYDLEVSSPGIDRPLTRLKDYDRWSGHVAKLELRQLVEGRKRFRGVLAGVEDENVCIDLEGEEETALVPFSLIDRGKLVLTDDLIRDALKASRNEESAANTNE